MGGQEAMRVNQNSAKVGMEGGELMRGLAEGNDVRWLMGGTRAVLVLMVVLVLVLVLVAVLVLQSEQLVGSLGHFAAEALSLLRLNLHAHSSVESGRQ